MTPIEISELPGFAEAVAIYLTPPKRVAISSWSALNAYLMAVTMGEGCEQFRVLFLDKKNQLISDDLMNTGTVDHAPVYPRAIAKRALLHDASAVILTHNHPSGDPTPSQADIAMTKEIVAALAPLKIVVHDHIVTGAGKVASLKALGLF
jgi:DNA repair protein RadC